MTRLYFVLGMLAAAALFVVVFRAYSPRPDPRALRDVCLYDARSNAPTRPRLCRCRVVLQVTGDRVTLIHASGRRERYSDVIPNATPPSPSCVAWGP